MEAMEFFRLSVGRWRSQRITHHLLFRQSEHSASDIQIQILMPEDPDIISTCHLHQVEPGLAIGGAVVTWTDAISGKQFEGESAVETTVLVLVPDPDDERRGQLLREQGYAEIVPVISQYWIDEDGLVLTTDYETMSSTERFWFVGPDLRLRVSTVGCLGGMSTASFCTETRLDSGPTEENTDDLQDNGRVACTGSGSGWPETTTRVEDDVHASEQCMERISILGW